MRFRFLLLFLLSWTLAGATTNNSSYNRVIAMPPLEYVPFKKGEKVEYTIRYGMIHAGTAYFEVADTTVMISGRPHYYVKGRGRSNRPFDMVFKVRDNHYSYIDQKTFLPTLYLRDTRQGNYDTTENVIFDRRNNVVKTGKNEHDVPGDIHDLLSAFYYARGVNFQQFPLNVKIDVKTFFAGDLFPVGAVVVGEEVVRTSYGTFNCLKIEPILIPGRVFSGQRDMTLYVTKDSNQIPVRIESEILIGRIKADLISTSNLKFPLSSKIN